jgi:hypothetical protein
MSSVSFSLIASRGTVKQTFFRSLLLSGSLLAAGAFAQTPTGTISGVVEDSTGAAVPNATVTVTNTATNVTQTLKTDGEGRYTQGFLNPGQYQVKVTATGFTPTEQDGITVDVAQSHPVDFSLKVGSEGANVIVQATTPALQTNNATTEQVITGKRILDLPLNGRNPFALAALTPGVNNTSGPYGASTPSFAGSRNSNNEQELDGITNILPENNVGNNSSAYQPIVDSVDEFTVQTSVQTPEYGRFSGGLINLATRTGTNKFHGSLFEFNRDAIFDATDYFATVKPPLLRNQAGGTIGGPIIKNRTFFFGAFEVSRETDSATETDSVATQAERNGDFSALLAGSNPVQLYDPHTVHPVTLANGTVVNQRDPYPNNQIPTSEMSVAGMKTLSYQPLPNVATNSLTSNYIATGAPTNNYYHFDIRVDHNWTQNWKTFVRFSHNADTNVPFADFPGNGGVASLGYGGPAKSTAYSLAYDNTFTLSPTLVFDVRYGFSRSTENRTPFGGPFDITTIGLPSSLAAIADYQAFPNVSVSGYSGIGSSGYVPLLENPTAHDLLGSFTKVIGGHELKFGGEFRKLFLNFHQYGVPTGSFTFAQSWTQQQLLTPSNSQGNGFADLLLGLPENGAYQSNDPSFASASEYYALYAQDAWRVTNHFTVNYGLRWDMDQPRTERHNQLSYWNPGDVSPINGQIAANPLCPACGALGGAMHFANTASGQYGRQQINAHKLDFGPRLGLIWSPDDQWAIRAGFGIVFAPSVVQPAGPDGAAGTEGFSSTTNANFSFDNEQTIAATYDNPFPTGYNLPAGAAGGAGTDLGNAISPSFLDSHNTRTPYSEMANLTVQRSLPGQTVVEVGWLFNQGQFLVAGDPGIPYDQVNPSYLSRGSALTQSVPNPFYGVITTPGSPLAQKTITQNQLLRPFPQYNGVTEYRKAGAYSNYNAVTARLDKRFAQGLTLLVAYTGAKLMDNSPAAVTYLGPYSSTYQNQYNPGGEYSVSPQDIGHQLVTSYTYELPVGPGKRYLGNLHGIVGSVIGGWQTSGIVSYIGGNPVVVGGVSDTSSLFLEGQRPLLTTSSVKISNPSRYKWFNNSVYDPSAAVPNTNGVWEIPPQYTLGNAPRTLGNVRTPRLVNADLSAIKNTYFGADQHYTLQFRFEAFNALNHVQLAPPDSTASDYASGTFGTITSTAAGYTPRNVQLAVKFNF